MVGSGLRGLWCTPPPGAEVWVRVLLVAQVWPARDTLTGAREAVCIATGWLPASCHSIWFHKQSLDLTTTCSHPWYEPDSVPGLPAFPSARGSRTP